MWTVHEDEYKNAESNLTGVPLSRLDEAEDVTTRPIGVYTKCSQVFATSSVTLTDSSTPLNSLRHKPNTTWTRTHTPISSSAPGSLFGHSQCSTSSHPSIMRFDAPPFEPLSLSVAAAVPYVVPSPIGKQGMISRKRSHIDAPEQRSLSVALSKEDAKSREKESSSAAAKLVEWNVPSVNTYHPHVVVRNYGSGITSESLRGTVYETAKDQHGCRFLQRLLADSSGDGEMIRLLISEIVPHIAELMTDQYANFFVQKLFDIMPHDVRYNVASAAAPMIVVIALTPHGTFSVQKMIETIATREEMEVIREALSNDVVRLVKDSHGNHVIQKVLQRLNHDDKEFVYTAVAADCVSIAKNKQGCCVLQRCLEYASKSQRVKLVKHILSSCLQIAEDPFGNYVLQYVLEFKDSKTTDTIAIAFLPHLVELCINKFSSNVMEKVLRGASQPVQEMYVEKMCSPDVVARLIQDDFGNYVLQTALTICSQARTETLVSVIRPLLPTIRNAPYLKKLEGKMEGILQKTPKSRNSPVECVHHHHLETRGHKHDMALLHRDLYRGREPRAATNQQLSS